MNLVDMQLHAEQANETESSLSMLERIKRDMDRGGEASAFANTAQEVYLETSEVVKVVVDKRLYETYPVKRAIKENGVIVDYKIVDRPVKKIGLYKDAIAAHEERYAQLESDLGPAAASKFMSPAHKIISLAITEITLNCVAEDKGSFSNIADKVTNRLESAFGVRKSEKGSKEYVERLKSVMELCKAAIDHSTVFDLQSNIFFNKNEKDVSKPYRVLFTPRKLQEIEGNVNRLKGVISFHEPMVCEPRDHQDLISGKGGYLHTNSPILKYPVKYKALIGDKEVVKVHPLIEKCNVKTAPYLFETINSLQKTPYAVDKEMLDLVPSIFEFIKNDTSRKKYDITNGLNDNILSSAHKFRDYENIYYPLFLDNRGRYYPYCTSGLSYQGNDLSKTLVMYGPAMGRKLNKAGVDALIFALGEYLDVAKVVGKTRHQITEDALPELLAKYRARDWSFIAGEKEPFGMISILKELANHEDNPDYICHKVLHHDACSSGIQLMGLFTGDYASLELTNVINSKTDFLKDLYLSTAADVEKLVMRINKEERLDSEGAIEEFVDKRTGAVKSVISAKGKQYYRQQAASIASKYEGFLNCRDIVKTPSMTYFNYGATMSSVSRNIVEKIEELFPEAYAEMVGRELREGENVLNEQDMVKQKEFPILASYCKIIWDAMQESNPAIVAAQKWIKKVIYFSCTNTDEEVFAYINPMNQFPVVLRRDKVREERVWTRGLARNFDYDPEQPKSAENSLFRNQRISHNFKFPTNDCSPAQTASSALPGVIHASDAAFMMSIRSKLGYVTGIHDSAGAHPNDSELLTKAVAETLYEFYFARYFESIAEQVGYTKEPVPRVDSIENPEVLKEALYAFS